MPQTPMWNTTVGSHILLPRWECKPRNSVCAPSRLRACKTAHTPLHTLLKNEQEVQCEGPQARKEEIRDGSEVNRRHLTEGAQDITVLFLLYRLPQSYLYTTGWLQGRIHLEEQEGSVGHTFTCIDNGWAIGLQEVSQQFCWQTWPIQTDQDMENKYKKCHSRFTWRVYS